MSLKEFDLIVQYFKRQAKQSTVIKAVGDDCAIVSVDAGKHLLMSMDTLVSGRHFPADSSPANIATRAFSTCLSDLAAMGAKPQWFTLALTMPSADSNWLSQFSESLFDIADEYQCDLIGGDTTQGPLSITIQVHGIVPKNVALLRSGARAGDHVFVTGNVGDGAAALSMLMDKDVLLYLDSSHKDYLQKHFYRPNVQVEAGQHLLQCATAAIDISDGLVADLMHIATSSQVDIEININALPISEACKKVAIDSETAFTYALSGGDDYQLAFTVPEDNLSTVLSLINNKKIIATHIGMVVPIASSAPDLRCYKNKKQVSYGTKKGYQHFAS